MLVNPNSPLVSKFFEAGYRSRYTLSKTIHYHSCGLIDYTIKLYIGAQLSRIGTDKDRLDEDAFRDAYFTCFPISLRYLEALRQKRSFDLTEFEDLKRERLDDVIVNAAKLRIQKRDEDEAKLREEAQRRRRSKKSDAPPPVKPEPVDPDDLPEAPADEFT